MGRTRIYADDAARARAWRARRRLDRAGAPPDRPPLGNDARAVVEWAAAKLRVPAGHPRSGEPFNLADLQIAIIDDVLTAAKCKLRVPATRADTRPDSIWRSLTNVE